MVFPTQQQSFEVIQLSSQQCVGMEILVLCNRVRLSESGVKKWAFTPRKDAVIPGFDQNISTLY